MKDGKLTMAEQKEWGEPAPRTAGDLRRAHRVQGLAGLFKKLPLLPKSSGKPLKCLSQGVAFLMVALGGQSHCFIFVCWFLLGCFKWYNFKFLFLIIVNIQYDINFRCRT